MANTDFKKMMIDAKDKVVEGIKEYKVFVIIFPVLYIVLCLLLNLGMQVSAVMQDEAKGFSVSLKSFFVPPDGTSPLLVLMFAAGITAALFFFTNLGGKHKFRGKVNKDAEGSARWSSQSEVRQHLTAVPMSTLSVPVSGIPLASDKRNYYVDTATVNSLIIGTSRSGKGQLIVLPMIRLISHCEKKQSFVANDPKGELFENTYDFLKANGYEIKVLNISNPENSSFYNPLALAIDAYKDGMENRNGNISRANEMVGELAQQLTFNDKSDPIWPESAKALLMAMILYLMQTWYENDRLDLLTMPNVYTFFLEYGSKNYTLPDGTRKNALDDIFAPLPANNPAKLAYATSKFAEGEMRASVFATLSSNLQIFADAGIAMLTSKSEIDFKELASTDHPTAIFMVVPEDKKNRYVLTSMFVNQCYTALTDISQTCPNRKLPRRVHFILDEFGNMVKIPDMDVKITVCLGRNILFNMFVQSLAQLTEKYQEHAAKTIQGNCGNLVYINSMDLDTNKRISEMLGNKTIETDSFSGEQFNQTNRSTQIKARPLMSHDELGKIQFGEVVVLRQRECPIKSELPPFYKLGIKAKVLSDFKFRDYVPKLSEVTATGEELMEALGLSDPETMVNPPVARSKDSDAEKIQVVASIVNDLSHGAFKVILRDLADGDDEAYIRLCDLLTSLEEAGKISESEKDLLITQLKM